LAWAPIRQTRSKPPVLVTPRRVSGRRRQRPRSWRSTPRRPTREPTAPGPRRRRPARMPPVRPTPSEPTPGANSRRPPGASPTSPMGSSPPDTSSPRPTRLTRPSWTKCNPDAAREREELRDARESRARNPGGVPRRAQRPRRAGRARTRSAAPGHRRWLRRARSPGPSASRPPGQDHGGRAMIGRPYGPGQAAECS
jgi:hypothetical protein